MYHKFKVTTDGNTYELSRKKVVELIDKVKTNHYNRLHALNKLDDGELVRLLKDNTSYLILGIEDY